MVGLDHALGVGGSRGVCRVEVVNGIASVAGNFLPEVGFCRGGARFGELPCDPSDFDDRAGCGEGEHDSHFQHDFQKVSNAFGGVLSERFGAIASLQDETLPLTCFGEPSL